MAEGRPLHGDDFVENMQDYVEERLTYASDSDELAEENHELRQELADLQNVQGARGGTQSQPDVQAITEEAELPSRMDGARGASEIEASGDGAVNYDHLAPEDEARARVTRSTTNRGGQGQIGR